MKSQYYYNLPLIFPLISFIILILIFIIERVFEDLDYTIWYILKVAAIIGIILLMDGIIISIVGLIYNKKKYFLLGLLVNLGLLLIFLFMIFIGI